MRVMLVTNGLGYGGAERIVEALALALHETQDVHVVATTRGGPVRDNLRRHGVPVSVLSIRSRVDFAVPLKIANVARRFRPDVLHSHLAVADIATAMARPFVPRARIMTTVHNRGIELDTFKRTLWHRALRRFDRIEAVSESVQASLAALPVDVVIAPPSLVDLDGATTRDEARRALGVGADEKLVLGVGRLAPIKGFDVLAAAKVNARVAVIGDGPERDRLGALELLGAREDAARLLAAADIVVCPSRSEGFPQVPLQAMAAGVPVVGTDVPGLREVVEPDVTGLLVPPEDPAALAAALETLLGDPARRRTLGEGGRRRLVERGLTRNAMVTRTLDAYRALLG